MKAHTAPEVRVVQSSGSECSNSSHFVWPCSHYPKASVFLPTSSWGVSPKSESTSPSFLNYKTRKIVHPGWFVVFTLFKVFSAKKYIYIYMYVCIYIHTHTYVYIASVLEQLQILCFSWEQATSSWSFNAEDGHTFDKDFYSAFIYQPSHLEVLWGSLRTHWGDYKLSPIIFLPESALKSTLL